jgi:hypothetical protein
MKNIRRNTSIAVLLCLCLVMGFVFSFVYAAEHADHDCAGAHCEICYSLHSAGLILKQIGAAFVAAAGLLVAASLLSSLAAPGFASPKGTNLVALKVKLSR